MENGITWVALDTSKRQHAVAVLDPGVDEPRQMTVPNTKKALERLARKLVREAPGEVRLCYEAGPCGFGLQREFAAAAPSLVCEVIAPALIPIRPGDRIKTDRRDAVKLVRFYRAGELTVVHPPSAAAEAVRDLVRCREDAKEDLLRAHHRLTKFLLRHMRIYTDGRAWTAAHKAWLDGITWEHEAEREVFWDYRLVIFQLEERLHAMDERIEAISQRDPYREPVGWLRCFRGIDTVTAMTLLGELHDIQRFKSARALMGYVGLVPSERSSGDRTSRRGITKTGNAHVRRVLVEAAWHARHRPTVGRVLRLRREGQPAWAIAYADRAMTRLSRRYARLLARGKPYNKVATAIARELAGFLWGVLQGEPGAERRAGPLPSLSEKRDERGAERLAAAR